MSKRLRAGQPTLDGKHVSVYVFYGGFKSIDLYLITQATLSCK